jgi:hypothetical protein
MILLSSALRVAIDMQRDFSERGKTTRPFQGDILPGQKIRTELTHRIRVRYLTSLKLKVLLAHLVVGVYLSHTFEVFALLT